MNGKIIVRDSYEELESALTLLGAAGRKLCIITDDYVSEFYLGPIYDIAIRVGGFVHMIALREGEKYKNEESLTGIYEALIRHNFSRDDYIIALGGGVVGDVAGFAAATFNRGMNLVHLPTSLLAQVDSSIGGKTGINYLGIKNAVGSFYFPNLVYTNTAALKTLTDREFSNGMAEVIKLGLIADENYFSFIENNVEDILKRKPLLGEIVSGAVAIKSKIVDDDPNESGHRMLLNFGHTIGHAIESFSEYSLRHGDCVSRGIVAAAEISYKRGMLTASDVTRIKKVLEAFSLPISYEIDDPCELLGFIAKDKKVRGGKVNYVLLNNIGNAFTDDNVTDEEIVEAVKQLHEQ